MKEGYQLLVGYKQWADRGLYHVLRENFQRLGPEEQGIMVRILDHVHAVDRIFQHHLQGRPHGYRAASSDNMPSLPALAAGTAEVDAWYVAYVRKLDQAGLDEAVDFTFTSGKPARMRRSEIIQHVCLHGTYHRGNAGLLLQKSGIRPNLDGVADYLDSERHADTVPA